MDKSFLTSIIIKSTDDRNKTVLKAMSRDLRQPLFWKLNENVRNKRGENEAAETAEAVKLR